MSQWTHINAVIRFDALNMGILPAPDLGNVCSYESDRKDWDECSVPCGSEGSMQYQVWNNPEKSCLASHTIMFWGDLRDYDNVDEILDYFNRVTKGQMIRSGILEINVEGSIADVYQYATDSWIKITA